MGHGQLTGPTGYHQQARRCSALGSISKMLDHPLYELLWANCMPAPVRLG